MLIDTSLLPDQDDAAPWDDSGGERRENRPGVQDLSDEMESENGTESNKHIFAPDAGNINNNGDKYGDFAQKMIAIAKRKRAAANDGWKQHESVPPVGIQDDIKKSDSGIAVREGKEFRQRDDLVIESREITQPEATERHETHEAEQSQIQQVDTRKNSEKWHHSYSKTNAAVEALMDAGVHGALFETVVMIAKFSRKISNGDWVFNLSGEQFGKRLGCNQKAASKRINDAVKAGFIEKIGNHRAGRTGATYRLKF
ncbi:hypothetical protein F3641_20265 [Escherichia coli]|nr:hypothetical protein [Escherichia coli]